MIQPKNVNLHGYNSLDAEKMLPKYQSLDVGERGKSRLGARIDPRVKPTAVRFSFSLQRYEGAEDTCTTDGPPWPDLFRPPASLNAAPPTAGTAWMATDQVRGLKAHGPSPAKGSSGCIERATNNRFRSTGQPWAEPGQGDRGLCGARYKPRGGYVEIGT